MTRWYNYLERGNYIDDRSVYECPDYKNHAWDTTTTFSYGYNCYGMDIWTGTWRGKDINAVANTSQCMMVADGGPMNQTAVSNFWIEKTKISNTRHANGTNILFVDGHVSWARTSEIPMSGGEETIWWNY